MVAGAAGGVGSRLVPLLVATGHAVTGLTRSPSKAEALTLAGATPVVADGLDAAAVRAGALAARPEAIVHEMTALSNASDLRRFDRAFAMTNRVRTEALDHLLSAARDAGTGRVVA
jgi:nucleoside-diphosphate-sugar epimerase